MISKNQIKLINSLKIKKYRNQHRNFIAEGTKIVPELFSHFKHAGIFATKSWMSEHAADVEKYGINEVSDADLKKISSLVTPNEILGIFDIPEHIVDPSQVKSQLSILLEDISDPGNLGTIVRIADWFGIEHIFCSENSVDVYNPKVIQATMGSITRVKVHYVNLELMMKEYQNTKDFCIYAATMSGKNIYSQQLTQKGFLLFGNESKGISGALLSHVQQEILVPPYPADNNNTAESLNVSIATAIICSEFRRLA